MIKNSEYYPEWQENRIKFILSKFPESFFKGKRILELGAYNGYIGARFMEMGADVLCVEGRPENATNIRTNYPYLDVVCADLDTADWQFGKWDIIMNFGLFYHLQNRHEEHMHNCLIHCDWLFFESVIYDSDEPELYVRHEEGRDQSITDVGGTPSTSYVENLFKREGISEGISEGVNDGVNDGVFQQYRSNLLNGNGHHYDWKPGNWKRLDVFARRFWVVDCRGLYKPISERITYNIVEVGANTGRDTAKFVSIPNSRVWSIEPLPILYNQIKENFKYRDNIEVFPIAISDFNGTAEFKVSNHLGGAMDYGCSSLLDFDDDIRSKWPGRDDFVHVDHFDVEVKRMDTFCEENGIERIDYLHCDAQGNDLTVLKSFGDKLSIVKEGRCEGANSVSLYKGVDNSIQSIISFLTENGFQILRVVGDEGVEIDIHKMDDNQHEADVFFKRI